MTSDLDVFRCVKLLLDQYRDEADLIAASRADKQRADPEHWAALTTNFLRGFIDPLQHGAERNDRMVFHDACQKGLMTSTSQGGSLSNSMATLPQIAREMTPLPCVAMVTRSAFVLRIAARRASFEKSIPYPHRF